MKQVLAKLIAERVKNEEVIGLGSGTTTEAAIEGIGKRIAKEGLQVFGIPTSLRTATVAAANGITVCDIRTNLPIHWAFDGADEVDSELNLMKGRGAAMLVEKIVASRAQSLTILVTEEKLVGRIGEKFDMPIEVISESVPLVEKELKELGASSVQLRQAERKYGEIVTDSGNLVLDASFPESNFELQSRIKLIPGVIETGLFWGFKPEVLVASSAGVYSLAYDELGKVQRTEVSP